MFDFEYRVYGFSPKTGWFLVDTYDSYSAACICAEFQLGVNDRVVVPWPVCWWSWAIVAFAFITIGVLL